MDNRILRSGNPEEEGQTASESLNPGYLVEIGGSDDIQAHSTEGGFAAKWFVREQREIEGQGVDDAIPSGDEATVLRCSGREKVLARLGTGGSEVNISRGDDLESAGDGTLQAFGTGTPSNEVVARAAEDVDNSGGSSEALIEVYVA